MNDWEMLLLALGAGLATYLSRLLPAVLVDRLRVGPRMERFLNLIPYTAMAALIFPGVLSVDAARPEIGIAGALAAALLAWRKCPAILCVLGAVAVDMVLNLL